LTTRWVFQSTTMPRRHTSWTTATSMTSKNLKTTTTKSFNYLCFSLHHTFRDVRFQRKLVQSFRNHVRRFFPIEQNESPSTSSADFLLVPPGGDASFPFVIARFLAQFRRERSEGFSDRSSAHECRDRRVHVVFARVNADPFLWGGISPLLKICSRLCRCLPLPGQPQKGATRSRRRREGRCKTRLLLCFRYPPNRA